MEDAEVASESPEPANEDRAAKGVVAYVLDVRAALGVGEREVELVLADINKSKPRKSGGVLGVWSCVIVVSELVNADSGHLRRDAVVVRCCPGGTTTVADGGDL
ncbi:MAG: hypothetical protein AAF624_05570 [Bacteroidota bacterium]